MPVVTTGHAAPALPTGLQRSVTGALDVLILLGVILALPFVILAIGLPFALLGRLLVQIGQMF
jgi:cobalamin biosynthesis protein CobD/CbiB